jgi:hypothetical protein
MATLSPMSAPNDAEVESVIRLSKIRRGVVYAALALLVFSLVQRSDPLSYLRAALWAAAGVLSIVEGLKLKNLGQRATNSWINAALYFGVAVLPLVARR